MNAEQVRQILENRRFPGRHDPVRLVETHISWVILTPDYAFKIKKALKYDFLDFSTLENRRFFCGEEVRLNRRLSPDMYLGVLPVVLEPGKERIGDPGDPADDYAVWMLRKDSGLQMDLLTDDNLVTIPQLEALAARLETFHRQATIAKDGDFSPGDFQRDFEDLYELLPDAVALLGDETVALYDRWRDELPLFLHRHAIRMRARFELGFWVEGHGDLHTRNIFLETEPVIFDCIEFNDHFRRLDVLNELAFLYMDLEYRGRADLAVHFLSAYRSRWEVMPAAEDDAIFTLFKAYRANVRLKVGLLELRQHQNEKILSTVRQYWILLKEYCRQIMP